MQNKDHLNKQISVIHPIWLKHYIILIATINLTYLTYISLEQIIDIIQLIYLAYIFIYLANTNSHEQNNRCNSHNLTHYYP